MAAQASDAERRAVATHVVRNDGDVAELDRQVGRIWAELSALAGRADDPPPAPMPPAEDSPAPVPPEEKPSARRPGALSQLLGLLD